MTQALNDAPFRTARVGNRSVSWTVFGDPAGVPMVYYHGAGGSRLEAAVLDADAVAAGVKVLAVDRPGCGRTDPVAGPTLTARVQDDLPAVLDVEEASAATVTGLSAGAMYAWAAAAAVPARVRGVVAVSPAVPTAAPAVRAALGSQFKVTAFLARRLPAVLAALQAAQSKRVQGPDGQRHAVRQMRKISPADALLLEDPDLFSRFVTAAVEGRRQGHLGGEEFKLMTTAWGFDPAAAGGPNQVVFGSADPLAPAIRAWLGVTPAVAGTELDGGHLQIWRPEGRRALFGLVMS